MDEIGALAIVIIALVAIIGVVASVGLVQDAKLCNVSFEGSFTGNIDLNKEYSSSFEVFEDFSVNDLKGKVSVQLPCKYLEERFTG